MKTNLFQPYLAGFVILISFGVHVGALFLTHGLSFSSSLSANKAYMENSHGKGSDEGGLITREEETRRKNEQLAELFQQVSQTAVDNRPKMAQKEPSDIPFKAAHNLDLPPEISRQPADVEVLFTSDHYLTDELIRATEMAQGVIEPNEEAWEKNNPTLKTGKETGGQLGADSINRSGALHEGRIDTLHGSGPHLGASRELGDISKSYFQSLNPGQQGGGPDGSSLAGFELDTLGSIASSNDFTLDVEVAKRSGGAGFIFRIELIPKPSVRFRRIRQNYFFLVDRSHSIRYARYEFTKQALIRAFSLLKPGDTFNLLVFDDHVVSFADKNVPWTAENVTNARAFLAQQKYGGLFATTDLYASLGQIVPQAVAENEVNTAILLSDGDTYLSSAKQRDSIAKWTRQNAGKVSLYSLASGKGNNLALLDLLAFFNKGMLHYCVEDRGIENSLFKLIEGLQNPIGKEMTLTAVLSNSDQLIRLFPSNDALPNLYEQTPFVVYGTLDKLQDFHLVFQGKYYESTLDIKQAVSFAQARSGDAHLLEKRLAIYQAYESYQAFLKDGKMSHLSRARQLLQPYNISIAFQ